ARVKVLTVQGPVPSHLMAVRKSLSPELKDKLRAALLELNLPENQQLLKDVYGAEGFAAVDDSHVNALRKALKDTGIEPVPGESFDNIGGPSKSEATSKPKAKAPQRKAPSPSSRPASSRPTSRPR